ncbi:MAG: TadE family protein [Candidatus Sulfotelmatobacter sp.]|jgi:TadE-like protein
MKQLGWTTWRDLAQSADASEIAETAMILPLFFMIFLAILWFGQGFRIYGTITRAAREGARAAVAPVCTTCGGSNDPSANAWAAVQSSMQAANLDPTQLQLPIPHPGLCACGASTTSCSSSTVPCDSSQTNICVQGVIRQHGNPVEDNVELSAPANGGAGECGVSVSFQYPYKFWLPFSSLNNQTINLRAQAQMRAETQ